MSVTVHGRAGGSVARSSARYGAAVASRAAAFEAVVGAALEQWLAAADGEYHLFHDLTGLSVRVSAWEERGLGGANVDHVILAGSGLIVVNAKACGAGSLTVRRGRGVLVHADGTSRPESWLDQHRDYAVVSALTRAARLDGPRVSIAWVVPDGTDTSSRALAYARCVDPTLRREPRENDSPFLSIRRRAYLELEPGKPRFGTGVIIRLGDLSAGVLATTWPRYSTAPRRRLPARTPLLRSSASRLASPASPGCRGAW
jgi:hypothetical protein